MVVLPIALSVMTLAAANVLIWRQPGVLRRPAIVFVLGMAFTYLFCMLSPLMLVQAVGSCFAVLGLKSPRYGRTLASALTVAACLLAWGFMTWRATDHWRKIDELRSEFPLVSIEDRSPEPRESTPFSDESLTKFEQGTGIPSTSRNRNWYWEQLHDDYAKSFAGTPGFGPSRMFTPLWMKSQMRRNTELPDPVPQPGVLRDEIDPSGDAVPDAKVRDFFGFHAGSIGSFVNFKGFGYLKSRREVAGFTPHAFESEPKPQVPYTLERLELVGLVRNPEPAVYVSEFLPRMAELGSLATRPADGFEAAGLLRLSGGEDLVANAVGPKVRLLGAIRNMTACVECHGGRRGDLLGAFSYRLAETK